MIRVYLVNAKRYLYADRPLRDARREYTRPPPTFWENNLWATVNNGYLLWWWATAGVYPAPRVPLDRDRHSFFAPVTPPPTLHQSPGNGSPSVFIRAYVRGITRGRAGDRYNLFLIGNLFLKYPTSVGSSVNERPHRHSGEWFRSIRWNLRT